MSENPLATAVSTQLVYLQLRQIQQHEVDIKKQIEVAEELINDQFSMVTFENLSKLRELQVCKENLLCLSRHLKRKQRDEGLLATQVMALERRNHNLDSEVRILRLQKDQQEAIVQTSGASDNMKIGTEIVASEKSRLDETYMSLSEEAATRQRLIAKLRAKLGEIHFQHLQHR